MYHEGFSYFDVSRGIQLFLCITRGSVILMYHEGFSVILMYHEGFSYFDVSQGIKLF